MSQINFSFLAALHLCNIRDAVKQGCNLKLDSPELKNIENNLNIIWLSCLNGDSSIETFKKINNKWLKEVVFLNKVKKELKLF